MSWKPTGLELSLLLVIAAVIAGAAIVGGGEEEPAREATAQQTTPVRVAVEPIKRRVERLRGLRFRRPLAVTFASPERASSLMRELTEERSSTRDQLIDEEQLKLLGLLRPSVRLSRYLRAIEDEQVLGFYDDRSKRLVVVRTDTDSRGLQEIVLAHELVHALEDQHFGIRTREGFNDDRGLAESALFEGTATALMVDYGTRYLSAGDALDALGDVGGTETKLPAFIEDLLIFPYQAGEQFVSRARGDGGWRAVDEVIRARRPRTSEQVIHGDKYAEDERAASVDVPPLGRILGRDWKRIDATSLGQFDLSLLFEHAGKVQDHLASTGWGGGRFELWRKRSDGKPCRAPCIARDAAVLALSWDSERDRSQGETAFTKVFEGLEGRPLTVERGLELWASRGGAIGMRGRGRRLTVVFAPSVRTAAALLRG